MNKKKQHLFSDTDTEYRGDDTKTDISWLRESNRKPKPQLVDYSRTRKQKKSKNLETGKLFIKMCINVMTLLVFKGIVCIVCAKKKEQGFYVKFLYCCLTK